MKHTCEKCSMDATFLKAHTDGLIHYYCDHHAPEGATRIGEAPTIERGKESVSRSMDRRASDRSCHDGYLSGTKRSVSITSIN